jgi:cellulose synthase/poly-beta-1,6-N-acetylglucosamine synthase-like glycosyltransferase
MTRKAWVSGLALPIALGVSGYLAARNYRKLPVVGPEYARGDQQDLPGVSIIVPARNEAQNLPRLLRSLTALRYPDYEVLVVDDASTDETAEIALSFAKLGVRVVQSDGPPPGWTGKNHACWLGVEQAQKPWLLFTDADTTHTPASLQAAIAFAVEQQAAALSLFTRQECQGFWERLLLPFAYQQYFLGVRPRRVNAPGGPALANGQYFLIRRDAYQAAGGHAASAASIIDDVALAGRLKASGVVPLACRGEALVSVRMYTSLEAIAEGFTKNSYSFLREQRATGALVALSTASAAGVLPTLLGTLIGKRARGRRLLALAAYGAQAVGILFWVRLFGVPLRYALLAPLGAMVFMGIALRSTLRTVSGRAVAWKGRSYRA